MRTGGLLGPGKKIDTFSLPSVAIPPLAPVFHGGGGLVRGRKPGNENKNGGWFSTLSVFNVILVQNINVTCEYAQPRSQT